MAVLNKSVPGAYQFFPLNEPEIGEALEPKSTDPKLFQPITLRNVTFKNRIFVSPMCQYSGKDGHATDWHLVHLGGYATRGVGSVMVEATAVVPEGRISPEDLGLWTDSQIEPLRRIVDFSHAQGTKIGIQLAHAGRKASTLAPWVQRQAPKGTPALSPPESGGWPDNVRAPSDVPFSSTYGKPRELSVQEIDSVVDAFVAATRRSESAGFDFIEIHGAHGYLVHEFLSPLSNKRTDDYGGYFENRTRLLLRLVKSLREVWNKPIFVRISATDWEDGPEKGENGEWRYWGPQQSQALAQQLHEAGVDLLDVSSGGMFEQKQIPLGPGYQVPFAEGIKKEIPDLIVGTVGLITEAEQAESYLQEGKADVIFLARELLRNPHWPLYAAQKLGVNVKAANQYERGWH